MFVFIHTFCLLQVSTFFFAIFRCLMIKRSTFLHNGSSFLTNSSPKITLQSYLLAFLKHLLCAKWWGQRGLHFPQRCLSFIYTLILLGRFYHYPHFTDEEIKAQVGYVSCQWSLTPWGSLGQDPRKSKPPALHNTSLPFMDILSLNVI